MKVLIVSHNCMCSTTNMGKTLLSYFSSFGPEELAQLYIHCEEPTEAALCHNYFRFTDLDALKSLILPRKLGKNFCRKDIRPDRVTARTDTGLLTAVYRYGERRTASVYVLRELLWKFARWETEKLWNWVEDFEPDLIFFASGDYGFSYKIAKAVADHVGKPLVVSCVDDHYLYNRNEDSALGRLLHRQFLKTVWQTMNRASLILTICDSLREEYGRLFAKPCQVLHTASVSRDAKGTDNPQGLVYLGKLELKREQQLIAIGRTLQKMKLPEGPHVLDVYSCDRDPEILKQMIPENGICFHGAVTAQEVLEIMQGSLAVLHTESFDPRMQRIVRHSVSTKIAESLLNGPCLIAYGPQGIASIDYLQEHGAAWVITKPEDLETGLREILTNANLRQQITERARELGKRNHSQEAGPANLRRWFGELCEERWKNEGITDQLRLS
ncbi:MAG: glycosyltransferase [Oscillospiraceae bacterium]|nr:glycosyltransferase [Oscillospiraceae bacterium]